MPESVLSVHVTPKGSRNTITGWREDVLYVKITAPPVEGAANANLVKFLAKMLGLRRQDITLISGTKSREKKLLISGLTLQDIRDRLHTA